MGGFAATLVAPTPMAGADPTVDCSAGVVVAVNYATWSGPIDTVCDAGTLPATAAYALQTARFNPVGVTSYGLAFICQIGGDPPDDSCQSTPPANAYWSLWYADSGNNSWTYSTVGAMGLEPQAGSVEYWVFGGASGAVQPPALTRHRPRRHAVLGDFHHRSGAHGDGTVRGGRGRREGPTASRPPRLRRHPPPVTPTRCTDDNNADDDHGHGRLDGRFAWSSYSSSGSTPARSSGGRTPPTGPGHAKATHRLGRTPSGGAIKIVSVAPTLARQPTDSPLGLILGGIAVVALAGTAGFVALRRRRLG